MSFITLTNVCVDFEVYGSSRSIGSHLRQATGGLISREAKGGRVSVRALEDINLSLVDGDRVGVIGHNGAGKTTLLRVFAGVYEPTAGSVKSGARVSSLLTVAPGVHADDTGYETIMTTGLFLGMTRDEVLRKTPDIERFTELGDYLSLPIRTYSMGMRVRLGFAIVTALDPEILVLDEGLGAGDARFIGRAKKRIDALIERSSILVLASHSNALIRNHCNKAVLLKEGKLVAFGDVDEVVEQYGALTEAAESFAT